MSQTLNPTPSATVTEQLAGSTLPYHSESTFTLTSKGVESSEPLGIFGELWAYRRVASGFVQRQLRLRYKGSIVGIFWSLIPPIVQVFVLTVVFRVIMNVGPNNLSAYMLCAFLPWTFFSVSILDASSSILEQLSLMKKTYFPREMLPIAAVATNTIHFGFGLLIFLVYRFGITTLLHSWPGMPPGSLLWLPLVFIDLVMLTLGVAFVVSAWTTFFEDIKFIIQTGLQLVFYAMPILYFAENIVYSTRGTAHVRDIVYKLYLANPLIWIIESFKQMFFSVQDISTPGKHMMSAPFDWRFYCLSTITSAIILLLGWREFQRLKWKFVERP